MTKAKFYADLNPHYPAKNQERYRVFIEYDASAGGRSRDIVESVGSTASLRIAEGRAHYLNTVFDELDGIFVEAKV